MELAHRLLNSGFAVTFVNTEFNHHRIVDVAAAGAGPSGIIGSRRLRLVGVADGMEEGEDRDNLVRLNTAMEEAVPPQLEVLLQGSGSSSGHGLGKVTCVVVDVGMSWALDGAKRRSLPVAALWAASAALLTVIIGAKKLIRDGVIDDDGAPIKLENNSFQLAESTTPMDATFLAWNWMGNRDAECLVFHYLTNTASTAVAMSDVLLCNTFADLEPDIFTQHSPAWILPIEAVSVLLLLQANFPITLPVLPFPNSAVNIWYQIRRSMEPYPFHYSRRPKPDSGVDSIDDIDPTIRFVFSELQKMESRLGDQIEGRCGGLESRVHEAEQKAEERFISLEMARSEVEAGRTSLEKHIGDIKLEVHRINRFFEQESLDNPQVKPSIFSNNVLASARHYGGAHANGPIGHRDDKQFRDREFGSVFTHTHDPGKGTNYDPHPLYYTMCFVDGLKDEIKSVIMVQRPSDLDSASALALVQEEAADSNRAAISRRYDPSFNRTCSKTALPLLPPP
ncbi:hypothetical protein PR202_gb07376 [Eleusine coracana subsp. coracana]|uniref:Uncharacterized protein n=1 Tax=Eleusine coracana subsp. coracana TaxID=191504 RepID=A0AAV5ECT9_ELECO|nr:hypothetical protein PR202_gb07376 [Eleusine coracana subsp. coracana]